MTSAYSSFSFLCLCLPSFLIYVRIYFVHSFVHFSFNNECFVFKSIDVFRIFFCHWTASCYGYQWGQSRREKIRTLRDFRRPLPKMKVSVYDLCRGYGDDRKAQLVEVNISAVKVYKVIVSQSVHTVATDKIRIATRHRKR